MSEPYYQSRASMRDKVALMRALLRKNAPDVPMPAVMKFLTATPEEPQKLATILAEEAKQLLAMDRYERRALSRRKFAVRAFDAARGRAARERD
jgi:hypothetical protein